MDVFKALELRITSDMYDKKLKQYKEQQAEMIDKMQAHLEADQEFYVTANTVLKLAKRALEIFESSEPAEKKQLLSYLFQNCLLNGKSLEYILRNPFDTIVTSQSYPLGGRELEQVRTCLPAGRLVLWVPLHSHPIFLVKFWYPQETIDFLLDIAIL